MTKMKYYKQAEKMYIYDKIQLEEIGLKLNLSRRTLFYWKKKYEWDRKRFDTERNQAIFSEKLFDFARKLMQKISKDIDNSQQPPNAEMYSLINILKNLPQVKQYKISKQKVNTLKPTKQLTPEMIDQIKRNILGINII